MADRRSDDGGRVTREVEDAREHVAPRWTQEREHRVRMAIEERAGRRRGRRPWMLTFAALSTALLAVALLWKPAPSPGPDAVALPERLRALEPHVLFGLADGTSVTALSPDARVEPTEVEPRAVTVRLSAGTARFSVTPNPERKLRVLSGSAVVTVLGTVFEVTRNVGGVAVAVDQGRVHVAWPGRERVLGAGESLVVPDARAEQAVASTELPGATEAEPVPHVPASAQPRPSGSTAALSWRTLAQDGNYAGALGRITTSGAEAVKNEPGDLLLAADVARLGGQPERAVTWLERVVKEHRGDSRAALAAFTLGRTLMDQLGRPREAAIAFGQARKLGKGGALAQDALAREVEGWSRAGEATLARERALEYVERYPKGRRLTAVKRLGEIE